MKRVSVSYFAVLREQAKCGEEKVATDAETAAALYQELAIRHGFALARERVKVAIDGDFAEWNTPLGDGVRVAFVPPVAGG